MHSLWWQEKKECRFQICSHRCSGAVLQTEPSCAAKSKPAVSFTDFESVTDSFSHASESSACRTGLLALASSRVESQSGTQPGAQPGAAQVQKTVSAGPRSFNS